MAEERSVETRLTALEHDSVFLAQMVGHAISGGTATRADLARLADVAGRETELEADKPPWARKSHDPDSVEPHDDLSGPVRPA